MIFDQLCHEQSNDTITYVLSLKNETLHRLPNHSSCEYIFRGLINASPNSVVLGAAVSTDYL